MNLRADYDRKTHYSKMSGPILGKTQQEWKKEADEAWLVLVEDIKEKNMIDLAVASSEQRTEQYPADVVRYYDNLRRVSSGELIGTQRMMFTTGLFIGLNAVGYRTRFCYERERDAVAACRTWDGKGDPPGLWIKEKPSDRLNPKWARTTIDVPGNSQDNATLK